MNEYDKRVARGVCFLDAIKPNWRSKIDLDQLDMSSGHWCMLGQLFGGYIIVTQWLESGDQFMTELGFASLGECSHITHRQMVNGQEVHLYCETIEYAWLENAWRDALKV